MGHDFRIIPAVERNAGSGAISAGHRCFRASDTMCETTHWIRKGSAFPFRARHPLPPDFGLPVLLLRNGCLVTGRLTFLRVCRRLSQAESQKSFSLSQHSHWIKCRTESCSFTGMLVSPVAPLRMSELVQTRMGQNLASP